MAAPTCWRRSRARSRPAAPSRTSPRARSRSSQSAASKKASGGDAQRSNSGPAAAEGQISEARARSKARSPGALPGFIDPQLASSAAKPPAGESWVHEVKFDGYRLIARIDRGKAKLKTRSGLDWTDKFPSLKKALEALPVVTAMLDGEVVVETEKGTPSFAELQADLSENRSDRFRYYLFDLMHLDGTDLTRAPLIERKRALAELLEGQGGILTYSRAFHRARRRRVRPRLPAGAGRHRLQAEDRALSLGPLQVLAQDQVRRQPRVRHSRLRALHHAAQGGGRARARPACERQARLRWPRRLGLLHQGGRGSLAQARGHPRRQARRRCRTRREPPQRALGQAKAGGGGGDPRLDRRPHRPPRRVQGTEARQGGCRCRA